MSWIQNIRSGECLHHALAGLGLVELAELDLRGLRQASGACARVPPRPAAKVRVRMRADRLWRPAAPGLQSANYAQSTSPAAVYQVV